MSMLQKALELAAMGLPVFPCKPGDKSPRNEHGYLEATTDEAQIRKWWPRWAPWADKVLIGVPTGHLSGISVLDIDPRNGGLSWFDEHSDKLRHARRHLTRSGGFHLPFRDRAGLWSSQSRIAAGVDVCADGHYIIWWPASGYEVIVDIPLSELPEWPDWIVFLPPVQRPTREGGAQGEARAKRLPDRYQLQYLRNYVARSREPGRNRDLFWCACRLGEMLDPRFLSEQQAIDLLLPTALGIGLGEKKAIATIRSGLRTGGQ